MVRRADVTDEVQQNMIRRLLEENNWSHTADVTLAVQPELPLGEGGEEWQAKAKVELGQEKDLHLHGEFLAVARRWISRVGDRYDRYGCCYPVHRD